MAQIAYKADMGPIIRVDDSPDCIELVRLKVDAIVTGDTPAVQAARNATTAIPIVMGNVADPVSVAGCQPRTTGWEYYGADHFGT
jgi:hypothetical protein